MVTSCSRQRHAFCSSILGGKYIFHSKEAKNGLNEALLFVPFFRADIWSVTYSEEKSANVEP